jgi:hypothetical protein
VIKVAQEMRETTSHLVLLETPVSSGVWHVLCASEGRLYTPGEDEIIE